MQADAFAAMPQDGSGTLKKALNDPRVGKLAQSLHLDLTDPAALNGLLAWAQRYVDKSSEVSPGQKRILARELSPGQSRYARDAIRTYLEIAAMK